MGKRPIIVIVLSVALFATLNFGAAGLGLLSETPTGEEVVVLFINAALSAVGGYFINKSIP